MLVIELISDSYRLSGIVAQGFENISNDEPGIGLTLLNDLLAEYSISGSMITYYTYTNFDTIIGQETYNIPNLVEIDTLTFNINTVRYNMIRDNRRRYFGQSRVDDLKSLPFHYYAERQLGMMVIYLYFIPSDIYVMKIEGKYSLSQVTLQTDLSPLLEHFYILYLKYALAKRIADYYDWPFSQQNMGTLESLYNQINNFAGVDLNVNMNPLFTKQNVGIYGQANLGKGWTT
jgi:hypothetical protein